MSRCSFSSKRITGSWVASVFLGRGVHIFLNFLLPVHIFMTTQYWQCNHSDDSEKSEIPSKNFVFKGADTDTTYTVKVCNMINKAKTNLRNFSNMIIVIPRWPWFWMVGRSQLFKRNWKLCPKWNHRLDHFQHFSVCHLFVCICLFVRLCLPLHVCLFVSRSSPRCKTRSTTCWSLNWTCRLLRQRWRDDNGNGDD